jgi:hypothetical protein
MNRDIALKIMQDSLGLKDDNHNVLKAEGKEIVDELNNKAVEELAERLLFVNFSHETCIW